jgi:hypothetical protein
MSPVGLLALVWSAALPARAAPEEAPSLVWRAPPECIGEAEVRAAVTRELGRAAFASGTDGELVVRGSVVQTPSRSYRVEVALERESGETVGVRSLTSDNQVCRSLDEAISVMLAIMLNVSRAEQANPRPSAWSYRFALGGAGTLGRMPGPGVELVAAGGPSLRRVLGFELELGVETGPEQDQAEGSVSARALSGRLGLSPILIRGRPELALRIAAGGGALQATAAGFAAVRRETLGFLELRSGPRLAVPLSGALFLEIQGDVGLMPVRPEFLLANPDGSQELLFQPSLVFGTLGLSLALRPP